ncbi:MAG TPA: hypothetical protein VLI70_10795 [Micrococcaceae bacterium]|jgi:hypothetical protein|nr:hypothetical protein [Micrococcaceae bacterium]
MTTNYVRGASITSAASRAEIREMLVAYGATGFRSGWEDGRAAIAFVAGGRQFLFALAVRDPAGPVGSGADHVRPGRPDQEYSGPARASGTRTAEETCRRHWYRFSLLVRAKLEAVASGIVTFEEEFLAYMVMPGGGTVFQYVAPAITGALA